MLETTYDISTIDTVALTVLQGRINGELLTLNAPGYEKARRLVNARFDCQPALIVRCRTAQDVAHAVVFARDHALSIAVRSGGHSVAGHSTGDGVLMIDLSPMRQISIDVASRTARVQPAVTNGELVLATQAYGLATTTGTCATVGMAGSTLGGGIGWLMGRFGATVDNVLAFELVTADGQLLTASATQHPDLFWALRGGGGNFGIVTEITYQLHELGPVLGGMAVFHLNAAPLALRLYRQLSSNAPDELMMHALMTSVPEFGPALIIQTCYSGADLAEGERVLAPLRRFGPPAIDLIAPRSYADLYMMMTPPEMPGFAFYDTTYSLRQPSDQALDTLVACALDRPTPFSLINVHQIHGAATRVAPDATAFALREPHYAVVHVGAWLHGTNDGAAASNWAWGSHARMQPFASPGVYVNFLGEAPESEIRATYRDNYTRLAAIKQAYDPKNVFCRNQNIAPTNKR